MQTPTDDPPLVDDPPSLADDPLPVDNPLLTNDQLDIFKAVLSLLYFVDFGNDNSIEITYIALVKDYLHGRSRNEVFEDELSDQACAEKIAAMCFSSDKYQHYVAQGQYKEYALFNTMRPLLY